VATEQSKGGILERGAGFFEKLHYGLGAVALVGAAVFPEFSVPLAIIGAWEIVHGGLWTVIKSGVSKKPQPAAAG